MAEHLASPCDTGLDLIADEKDIVLVAKGADLLQVAVVRHDDTCFTLDGLNKECSSVLAVLLKDLTYIIHIVVANRLASRGVDASNVRQVWTVVLARLGVGGHSDCSELDMSARFIDCGHAYAYGSSVEVLLDREDQSLVLRDSFNLVSPLARNLDCGLNSLSTSVHGQDHVKAKQLRGVLSEAWEHIVVERATAESQSRSLLCKSLDKLGVAVALVHSAVRREEVKIVLLLRIPHAAPACAREDWIKLAYEGLITSKRLADWKWVVVVSGVLGLCCCRLCRRRCMVL